MAASALDTGGFMVKRAEGNWTEMRSGRILHELFAKGTRIGKSAPACGLAIACALSFSGTAAAQSNSNGADLLNQLLMKALQGAQQQGTAGAQAQQSGGYLDTPENLQKVVADARNNRTAVAGIAPSNDCQGAMGQMRPGRLAGTGYLELLAKCEAELEKDASAKRSEEMQAERKQAEFQRQKRSDAEKRADDYAAGKVQLVADLKAGSKKPQNCAQWLTARGLTEHTLKQNEVSKVAYRAPTGSGYFEGKVQRIEGDTFLLSLEEGHLVLLEVQKTTELYKANQLRVQSKVAVIGSQTGTRKLTRGDGSSATLAVVTPACLGAEPNFLLDLAPS